MEAEKLIIWTEIFRWNSGADRIAVLHSFICDQFFCTLDTQIFKFWLLKLKLHDILTFRWESDTSGVLSLYSPQICLNPIQDGPGTTKAAILPVFTLQLLKT